METKQLSASVHFSVGNLTWSPTEKIQMGWGHCCFPEACFCRIKKKKKNALCMYICVVIGINLWEIPVVFSVSFKIYYSHPSALKVWCNPKHPTGATSLIYPEACHSSRPLTSAPQHRGTHSAHVACQPGAPVQLSPTSLEWRQKMAQICLHPLLSVNTVITRSLCLWGGKDVFIPRFALKKTAETSVLNDNKSEIWQLEPLIGMSYEAINTTWWVCCPKAF